MRTVKIANGQGFWGDSLEAPIELIRGGPVDYLTLDYLAEVTMSILQKQRARDSGLGFARDFVGMLERTLPEIAGRGITVVANAGGVNPGGCRDAVREVARSHGLGGKIRIGVVEGDDILGRLDDMISRGVELRNMDTGEPLAPILPRVQSANVYLGARPIAEALQAGARVIITGRSSDAGLALGPMIHEFGWAEDDWDRLAAGMVAGHVIECGAQSTGGNCQVDWESIPDLARIGYPVVEMEPDGSFVLTKHPGTGGRITEAGVKEQIVYEIGDPRCYITPDCTVDFTSLHLEQQGPDRVRFTGMKGGPAPEMYKASISYLAGYKAVGTLVYAWPDALKKAKAASRILKERLNRLGLRFEAIRTEFVGANSCHGELSGEPPADIAEIQLRVGVRSAERRQVERFTREIAPLVLNGPPTATGYAGGRPKVEEVIAFWPALVPRSEISPRVSVTEA